jgi:hypothetical protein
MCSKAILESFADQFIRAMLERENADIEDAAEEWIKSSLLTQGDFPDFHLAVQTTAICTLIELYETTVRTAMWALTNVMESNGIARAEATKQAKTLLFKACYSVETSDDSKKTPVQ